MLQAPQIHKIFILLNTQKVKCVDYWSRAFTMLYFYIFFIIDNICDIYKYIYIYIYIYMVVQKVLRFSQKEKPELNFFAVAIRCHFI